MCIIGEGLKVNGIWIWNSSSATSRTARVSYAYWGKEKYFQQEAVVDQGGRISFTDYFDNAARAGKKGQGVVPFLVGS